MEMAPQKPIILAVDDDPTNLRTLGEILKENYRIYLAPSGMRALAFLQQKQPDLILLDVEMPDMSGYQVIREIKRDGKLKEIPVIFLTGLEGRDNEKEALDLGAVDYILKPISAEIVKARAGLHIELETYRKNLENMVTVRTSQLHRTQDAILDMLANMTSVRDSETGEHIKRTTFYIRLLTDNLQAKQYPGYMLEKRYAESVVKCAKLHDIGKVAVPDHILLKPAKLTTLEFEMIKQHTLYGAMILDAAIEDLDKEAYFLQVAREIIISHHEKWDGSGYPKGLKGEGIPLAGRLMAIADVYDALISHRPYKVGFSHKKAVDIITQDAGTHFDPMLLELSSDVLDEFRTVALRYQDRPSTHFN